MQIDKFIVVGGLGTIVITLLLTFCSDDRLSTTLLEQQRLDKAISQLLNEELDTTTGEEND